jgi:hypothetical protein
MEWFRSHPYSSILAATGALVILGVLFTHMGAPAAAPARPVAWGGAGTVQLPTYAAPQYEQQHPPIVSSAPPYSYALPTLPVRTEDGEEPQGDFDYDAFIAFLTDGSASTSASAQGNVNLSAYTFIPTGIVATAERKSRTQLQQTLYRFGNNLGESIQGFEQQHPNVTPMLTDFLQDRSNAEKIASVRLLAQHLSSLGAAILSMGAPPQAADAARAVGESYRELGLKLAAVPSAQSDQELLSAIQSYNASADAFVRNYVALAQLFLSYGVTFSREDPGNVFTFTNTAGL